MPDGTKNGWDFRTIIEPFKIKMVEPLHFTTRAERERILESCAYNLFAVHSEDVLIDLLTDSGTNAMSQAQWSAMMQGDESYAGSRSFYRFEAVVKGITGYRYVIPTHQGRAAERILFSLIAKPGSAIPSNAHFDTTRANIEYGGAEAVDLPIPEAMIPSNRHPFKGNMDVSRLEAWIRKTGPDRIPLGLLTVTNNTLGGQPVSMENIRETRKVLAKFGIPLFLDVCRFAENASFIQAREAGFAAKSPRQIAQEMFGLADGCLMSAKKDGLVNMGGFLALNHEGWARAAQNLLILTEGFPMHGGLAGRDLEAIAVGLEEALEDSYLQYRLASTRYLAKRLEEVGVPMVHPAGGHAVYLDAGGFLPHLTPGEYPGQSLVIELYREGGLRTVEVGSVMLGKRDPKTGKEIPASLELVRLALPRRVYTQSHVDYVAEVVTRVFARRHEMGGVEITEQPEFLRHFTAKFRPRARALAGAGGGKA